MYENLKNTRLEKGISIKEIAKVLEVTPAVYSKWERSEYIPIHALALLSTFYGVSVDYLVGLTDQTARW